MYHIDKALSTYLQYLQQSYSILTPPQSVIILRDLQGRISCHLLNSNDSENFRSQFENKLTADKKIRFYCAAPFIIVHEPDDSLWKKMFEMAQPLFQSGLPEQVKIIERIFEGQSWLQSIDSPILKAPPYIISFYSFKGGVGRTTAAAMTGLKLAREGKRVCLIDMDLEAPGLSHFAPEKTPAGIIDYLLEQPLFKDEPLEMDDYLVRLLDQKVENRGGELWLLPVGDLENGAQHYLVKLGRLDFQAMVKQGTESALNRLFIDLQAYKNFDYFIVDSRTGITDIGGLAINSLSHLNVMLFNLGEQNVQGMHFVLQHFAPILQHQNLTQEEIASRLLFVFSPVPFGGDEQENKMLENDLRETAYEVTKKYIYERFWAQGTSFPSVEDDETPFDPVPHHPVFIRHIRELPLKSDLQGIDYAQSQVANPPYDELVRRIVEVKLPLVRLKENVSLKEIDSSTRQGLSQLITEGDAETDLNNEEKLRERFLPLPQFRFLFEPKAFLILGRKGSGKSALFQVLHFPKYINDLANYFKISNQPLLQAKWIVGFSSKTHQFLSADLLSNLGKRADKEKSPSFYTKFWKYLAVWEIQKALNDKQRILSSDLNIFLKQLFDFEVNLKVDQFLNEVENKQHYPEIEQIYLVYDYLDRMVGGDLLIRSKYVSGLIEWWQSRIQQNKRLLAKVFLREDIYNQEVDVEDKSKIREGVLLYKIRWDGENTYRLFFKVAFEYLSPYLEKNFPDIYQRVEQSSVGIIPPQEEKYIRPMIESLIGEYMGTTPRKGYTFNWIPKHLLDSQKQLAPRWIIALFAEAAKLALDDNLPDPIIPQKMIRRALQSKVSQIAVDDLRVEYKQELRTKKETFLPDSFNNQFTTFPQSQEKILTFIESRANTKYTTPDSILSRMEDIGLLEKRKPTKKYPEVRYQIPDIYLYGLGLSRRG
jgi:cellulose biosynthesis protein BcsQ